VQYNKCKYLPVLGLDEGKEGQYVKITTFWSRDIYLPEEPEVPRKGEKGD
jgi:hypothetical protein